MYCLICHGDKLAEEFDSDTHLTIVRCTHCGHSWPKQERP